MAIHPNMRKGSMTPKEKAQSLADQFSGQWIPHHFDEKESYWGVPITVRKRDYIVKSLNHLSTNEELTQEDRDWWKEVQSELKKIPDKI